MDELVGPDTVNTVPPATLDFFLDHGSPRLTINDDISGARARARELDDLGIDLDAITAKLQDAAVEKFATSFDSLKQSIAGKREKILS